MVKVISLSNEAYRRLKARKGNKSFSEVVIELDRLNMRKGNIMKFAGAFAGNADEWERIKKKIYSDRAKAKLKEVKL